MKKWFALALAMVMLLGLCASASAATVMIGWPSEPDSAYLTALDSALEQAFLSRSLTPNDTFAGNDFQQQLNRLNEAVLTFASGYAIDVITTPDADIAKNMVTVARRNGNKPIIFFENPVEPDETQAAALFESYEYAAYVGHSAAMAGEAQGAMAAAWLLARYDEIDLNGDGVISYVLFRGDDSEDAGAMTAACLDQANAALAAAGKPALHYFDANDPNGFVPAGGSGDYVTLYLQNALPYYTEAGGNMIELVLCGSDAMAVGAVAALAGAGYNNGAGKAIPVFGAGGTDEAQAAVAAGTMAGTVAKNPEGMAEAVATLMANMLGGQDKLTGLDSAVQVKDGWFVQIPWKTITAP